MSGEIRLSLSVKEFILWILVVLLIFFSVIRYIQIEAQFESGAQANQIKLNSQNIQGIVDWIKRQEALKKPVDLTELVKSKEKEK